MTWSIEDRIVVITGGNSGIGFATASALARRGASVVVTARDQRRGQAAADRIGRETGQTVTAMVLDLASFDSVRSFVGRLTEDHGRPDVLINNAGVYMGSKRRSTDGYEWTMGVNHLGPFLLTCLLSSNPETRPHRVVTVASEMHRGTRRDPRFDRLEMPGRYRGTQAYARSKLANILFTRGLAKRLANTGDAAFAVHPGMVATRITRDGDSRLGALAWTLGSRWMRTPAEGAATSVYLATEPGIDSISGGYFADRHPIDPAPTALDDEAANRLWQASIDATGCRFERRGPSSGSTVASP